ncbi:alkylation response protein AidB-like acyl-CoA dehydrogenase [Brevundimonas sp. SORGH_AS 993]|nr:alkylation response protein AidB-like acyl-CoA dehydrogenase [Brevundimonas sp. SORGH_AS_0993]
MFPLARSDADCHFNYKAAAPNDGGHIRLAAMTRLVAVRTSLRRCFPAMSVFGEQSWSILLLNVMSTRQFVPLSPQKNVRRPKETRLPFV